jgi:hypothetical protein
VSGASNFSAYRVRVAWNISPELGGHVEDYYPYDAECDDTLDADEGDETYVSDAQGNYFLRKRTPQERAERERERREHREAMERWKMLTPEVRNLLSERFRQFAQLGCITGECDDGTPSIFLITEGECEFPKAKTPWNSDGAVDPCLGLDQGRALETVLHTKLQTYVWIERVEPLDAFKALRALDHDYELGSWGGERTPELLPWESEGTDAWLARVAVANEKMREVIKRLNHFDLDLDMALSLPFSAKTQPDPLVEGLLALAELSSIVGPSGAGKSTLCQQLLTTVAAPIVEGVSKTFLGCVVPDQFDAVLFSGEEPEHYFVNRKAAYDRQWPGAHLIFRNVSRTTLRSELARLKGYALREKDARKGCLVLDNFQVFSEGDDTKAHVADEFYSILREWARETGWAVIVIHHTTKTPIKSFARFRTSVRGSAVHIDGPRKILGMLKHGGDLVEVGVVKSNAPVGFDRFTEGESFLCRRDPTTLTLNPVDPSDVGRGSAASGDDIERVAEAVGQMNKASRIVHKSGSSGLYEQRLPILSGLSRGFIHDAIDSLIEIGRVEVKKAGLRLVEEDVDTDPAP